MNENMTNNVVNETEKEKTKKPIIIIFLCLIIIGLVGTIVYFLANDNDKTAVIVKTDEQLQDVDDENKPRFKMNSYVYVAEGTMQNLEFCNLNKEGLLKIKINVGSEEDPVYIYESPFVKEGALIRSDVVDTSKLKNGDNDAIAEIYSYTKDEKVMSQRNVLFTLNCDK